MCLCGFKVAHHYANPIFGNSILAKTFFFFFFYRGALLKRMEADLGLKETSENSLGEKFDDLVRS